MPRRSVPRPAGRSGARTKSLDPPYFHRTDRAVLVDRWQTQVLKRWTPAPRPVVVGPLDAIDRVQALFFFFSSVVGTRRPDCRIVRPRLPLSAAQARLVRETLAHHRKKLDESAFSNEMRLLIGKQDAGNPVYLRLACHELRLHGVFERLGEFLRQVRGNRRHGATALRCDVAIHRGSGRSALAAGHHGPRSDRACAVPTGAGVRQPRTARARVRLRWRCSGERRRGRGGGARY